MNRLLFIKNQQQLQFIQREMAHALTHGVLFLTVDPEVWYELAADNKAVLWAGDFVGGDDWAEVESQALSLRDGWYRPFEKSLVYEGINLAELIRLEHTHFFRQAVRAQMIISRIFDNYAVSDLIILGRCEVPCRDRNRVNNKNGVFEAVLLAEAHKRGIRAERVSFDEPSPKSQPAEATEQEQVGKRIFAFDCWQSPDSSKLIAVGSPLNLIILEPFVRAWSELAGCEGLLLNLRTSIELRNKRAGFRLPENTPFASLADVSTYNQSSDYQQTQGRILDALNEWKNLRCDMEETSILKNPHLNFHWTCIWNTLMQLPLTIQKASEALRIMTPDVVLTDEMAASSIRVFTEVAKKKGILTVECPHGYVSDIEQFRQHGDLYLAWGRETVKQLSQHFKMQNQNIVVTGSPVNERVIKSKTYINPRRLYGQMGLSPDKKTVCVVTRSIFAGAWPVDINDFFTRCDEIAALALNQDIQIIIKASPRVDHVELYKRIFGEYKNIYICTEYPLDELWSVIDVGIMFYYTGTASLLFLHRDIPTIFVHNKSNVNFTDSAWRVFEDNEPLSKLCNRFLYDAEARHRRLAIQKSFAQQHLYIDDNDVAPRAARTIKDTLKNSRGPINSNEQRNNPSAPLQSEAGPTGSLAIFAPQLGGISETFITRQIDNLAPGRTVLVTGLLCETARPKAPCLVTPNSGGTTVYHSQVEEQVVRFLAEHKVTHILSQYGCHGQSIVELNRRRLHLPVFVHFLGYDASKLLRNPQMVMYYRWMGQNVTGVIALSEKMANRLAGIGIPPHKIKVIQHGVEIPHTIQARPQNQPTRFVSVIRLVPKKGPLLLLEAFGKVSRRIEDCTLDVIGDGKLRPEVERFIDLHGLKDRVKLHGYQPHEFAMEKIRNASVYVQHSITDPETGDAEGLPHIILEASAAGLPVVSTLHEGIPDEVQHGVTGFLVKEGDVDAMAEYMISLAQNPQMRRKMGIAAYNKIAAEFNLTLWMKRLGHFITSSHLRENNNIPANNDTPTNNNIPANNVIPAKAGIHSPESNCSPTRARKADPKVSIIMSCYNCEKFLTEALDSILAQTMTNWELLCLDDGSTDSTKNIITEYAAKDDRIKPFYFDGNEGPYVRRNFAIARANSEFIMIHDSDDIMVPDKVQQLYEEISKDNMLAVLGAGYLNFADRFRGAEFTEKYEFPIAHTDILNGLLAGRHAICHASCIIRKELFEAVGLYDGNRWGADAFWLAKVGEYIRLNGRFTLKNIPRFLMLRRIHLHSQSCTVGLVDPRSERKLYKQYYRRKLKDAVGNLDSASPTEVSKALKNCDCSDFLQRFRKDIAQLKAQPVDLSVVTGQLSAAQKLFKNKQYVSCISAINNAQIMCPDIVSKFKSYNLLRAMCYVALDMKPESLEYLDLEIQNHRSRAAKQFRKDYFERQLTADVQQWYAENKNHFDLQIAAVDNRLQNTTKVSSGRLNILSRKLEEKSWQAKLSLYEKFFENILSLQHVIAPDISVIVISWRFQPDTIKSFESLMKQRNENFELVFVDNGSKHGDFDSLKPFIDTYVRLNQNTGAYLARNIGAVFAHGRILLFLDDDGIPAPDILQSYRRAFDEYDAVAVRGAVWPKDKNAPPYTEHLYYGDAPFPYFSCQEGNTAYLAAVFYQAGGWDDEIILGGAGLDLSRRLLDIVPDMRKQIYWPGAVLYHDRNDIRDDWEQKKKIREASIERLKRKHPDYGIFQQCYKKYFQRRDLLIHKNAGALTGPDAKEAFRHLYQNQEFVKALQPMPKNFTHTNRVLALNDKAENLMANGDMLEAMRCLTEAFRLDPADYNTVSNICRIYKQIGWTKQAESLMRRYAQSNSGEPGRSKRVELLNRKSNIDRNGDLKFSFIMIVLNGMPFIEYSLKSIYDFAHEIIIAEGAVVDCMFAANPDGSSKDGTVKFIKSFPDPERKIKLIQAKWPEKCEMQNEAVKYVTGDYVWLIDSDEVYKKCDLEKINELLRKDASITQVNFIPDNFWKGLDYIFVTPLFFDQPYHYRRLFKYVPGARFVTHRPPTMVWPDSSLTTEQMNLVDGSQTRRMGIILYHYSYVVHEQVAQKMEYYGRRGPWEVAGLSRSKWYQQCYLKWTPQNRKEIEARYPVWMGDKNSRTESFRGSHPKVMNDFIKKLDGTKKPQAQADTDYQNSTAVEKKKNALVSYITAPLRMGPNYHPHKFSNPGIARSIVKVLTQMGYIVDLIDFDCKDFKTDKVYDLFIGHAGINFEYLSRNVAADAVKIYFSTSLYWKKFNRLEAARFENLRKRRGVRLPYDRWINVSEEFAVHDADGIICLGNQFAAQSYSDFPLCICVNNGIYKDDHYDRTAKDFDSARGHFLYFGSAGNVHKGLDLLIEAFMQIDAHLWCTGNVEPAFYKVYEEELSRHPNIHFVNPDKMVPLRSPLFYELMDKCNFVILPSCAEGSCGGVIECMNQGLIPIVSRGATIDVDGFGIMLLSDSVEEIVRVVREVTAKPAPWHREHSIMTRRAVLRDFSQKAFCTNIRTAIERVIVEAPKIRIEHKKGASEMSDDPAGYLNKYADNLGALLRGAEHLKAINRDDEAAMLLQRAVAVDSSCVTALSELAVYYLKNGKIKEAAVMVERALKLSPCDRQSLKLSQNIKQPIDGNSLADSKKPACHAGKFTVGQPLETGNVKSILWLRTDSIGDAVLSSSMLPYLPKLFPGARITVLCQAHIAPLYRACPFVDEIITVPIEHKWQSQTQYQTLIKEVQKVQPDILLNSTFATHGLADVRGLEFIPRRVALRNVKWASYTDIIQTDNRYKPELQRHCDFLRGLGADVSYLKPKIWTTDADEQFARDTFEKYGLIPERTIALFAGTRTEHRFYEKYGKALEPVCRKNGYSVIALGSENDYHSNKHNLDEAGVYAVNLSGGATLRQSAAILKKCFLAVGAETALAHIACAVETPNVILLGGGHFGRFMPYSQLTSVVCLALQCFGCDWKCRYNRYHCVRDVLPEVISQAISHTIAATSKKPRVFIQGVSLWNPKMGEPAWKMFGRLLDVNSVEVMLLEPCKQDVRACCGVRA